MEEIPPDILRELFKNSTVTEIVRATRVSKRWRRILMGNGIWRPLLQSDEFKFLLFDIRDMCNPMSYDAQAMIPIELLAMSLYPAYSKTQGFSTLHGSLMVVFMFMWNLFPHVWLTSDGSVMDFKASTVLADEALFADISRDFDWEAKAAGTDFTAIIKSYISKQIDVVSFAVPYLWLESRGSHNTMIVMKQSGRSHVPPTDIYMEGRGILRYVPGSKRLERVFEKEIHFPVLGFEVGHATGVVRQDNTELDTPEKLRKHLQNSIDYRAAPRNQEGDPRVYMIFFSHGGVYVGYALMRNYIPVIFTGDHCLIYRHEKESGQVMRLRCSICDKEQEEESHCSGCKAILCSEECLDEHECVE